MTDLRTARMLARYNAWADREIFDAVAALPPGEAEKPRQTRVARADMLLHIVNHTTYHRGWVAEMFFEVPARCPAADLPDFLIDVPQTWDVKIPA